MVGLFIKKRNRNDKRVRATIIQIETNFLSFKVKAAFICLQTAFTKTPIFHYFDPKRHIKIKSNVSGFAIGKMPSQLLLNNYHVIYNYNKNHDHLHRNPLVKN